MIPPFFTPVNLPSDMPTYPIPTCFILYEDGLLLCIPPPAKYALAIERLQNNGLVVGHVPALVLHLRMRGWWRVRIETFAYS